MRVKKLDLCKQTLMLLLRELHHDDRFSLISFSDEAKVEIPICKVNEEQKQKAMHTIEHLHVRGRTNISSAISLAAQVVNGVSYPNKVRSVFLLTDGCAVGKSLECSYADIYYLIPICEPLPSIYITNTI